LLLHVAELALLGKVTGLLKTLLLLGGLVLLGGNDASPLVHQ